MFNEREMIMPDIVVNNISASVQGPYPVWIDFKINDTLDSYVELRLRHNQLRDFEYVLKQVMRITREKLGKDAREV